MVSSDFLMDANKLKWKLETFQGGTPSLLSSCTFIPTHLLYLNLNTVENSILALSLTSPSCAYHDLFRGLPTTLLMVYFTFPPFLFFCPCFKIEKKKSVETRTPISRPMFRNINRSGLTGEISNL